jgi:NADH-quinone oxidoreductase subunit L
MRQMGGLRKYMPITWITSLIGSLALIGAPGFSGFFSKDSIIEAVGHSTIPGAGFAYFAVLAGVFITALYSFRMYFLVFHGKERMDAHTRSHLHESPAVVTVPLILLAIPSVVIGWIYVDSMVFGDFFANAITVLPEHDVLSQVGFTTAFGMVLHGLVTAPFWLALAGVGVAWYLYMHRTDLPAKIVQLPVIRTLYAVLQRNYGFDEFNNLVFGRGSRGLGTGLWKAGDVTIIDGLLVNGSARLVGLISSLVRHVQSGYLYHYAFAMIIGLLALFGLFVVA